MRMIGSVPEVRNISQDSSLAIYFTPSKSFIWASGTPSNDFGGCVRNVSMNFSRFSSGKLHVDAVIGAGAEFLLQFARDLA